MRVCACACAGKMMARHQRPILASPWRTIRALALLTVQRAWRTPVCRRRHMVETSRSDRRAAGGSSAGRRIETPWPHYASDWSKTSGKSFAHLAIASSLPARNGQVQVGRVHAAPGRRERPVFPVTGTCLTIDNIATKVKWSPARIKECEYLAASGDGIYIWKALPSPASNEDDDDDDDDDESSEEGDGGKEASTEEGQSKVPLSDGPCDSFLMTGRLLSKATARRASTSSGDFAVHPGDGQQPARGVGSAAPSNPPGPITSFDWNEVDPMLIVTASYDTTCTVWSLETGTIKTQLIAHDKEVFDVAFSRHSVDTFVSVGADGSLRLFDIR